MKKFNVMAGLMVAFLVGSGLGFMLPHKDTDRLRRMKLVETSFETGCYQFSQLLCPISGVNTSVCYFKAINFCPKQAQKFRKWIENGKKLGIE